MKDLTGNNSRFLNMACLSSLGFEVVPGALGIIEYGIFKSYCEYRFEAGKGVYLKKPQGEEIFNPFHANVL
jgi:hypothetical protein